MKYKQMLQVLMLGRPKVGKSSIVSMLINRDVVPGLNQGGIIVNDSFPSSPDITSSPSNPFIPPVNSPPIKASSSHQSHSRHHSNDNSHPAKGNTFPFHHGPPLSVEKLDLSSISLSNSSSSSKTLTSSVSTSSISPDTNKEEDQVSPRPRTYTTGGEGDIPPSIQPHAFFAASKRPTIYHSDKYLITDVEGLQEGSTDVIGSILELRRWLGIAISAF